jgi:hypothetical protein
MADILLMDCCQNNGFIMNFNESATTNKSGLMKFRGKFQEAEAVNKNKRSYPFHVLDENVKKLQETIKYRGLIGELDHPTDSIVHFEKASHVITKLWWEGNVLMGEGEILDTPHGKILKSLINNNVRVGISSRGVGNGSLDENGILVIGESYKLITFDVVADPSTPAAFQERVVNTKKENFSQDYYSVGNKNEVSSIHNKRINKDAVIACFGGIIKEQISNIKTRL